VAPVSLATNAAKKRILGYTMPFLSNTEPIIRFGEKSFREAGVTDETVVRIFRSLRDTVQALHQKGVVIGDFNDLNVLVKVEEPFIIDADSMQFGKFFCRVFTGKFVDPVLCDPSASSPLLAKPHNEMSDWYAYLVMLMQSLLFVGPYGGVYKPQKSQRVSHDARPLHRITVWNPEVRYPKPAKPLERLPDTMIDFLRTTFEKDKRGIPPASLLDSLQFDSDGNLLVAVKIAVTPTIVKEIVVGRVRAEKVFETTGRIVFAAYQGGKLRWLYYQDGQYKREDGSVVVKGPLFPNIRFRISGEKTVIAQGGQALVFTPGASNPEVLAVDTLVGQLPLIDAIEQSVLFVSGGELKKTMQLGTGYAETIGTVLPNQTLFWTSEKLGFGFYRAGQLARYFVFDPRYRGLNDSVELPAIAGQLIDSTCFFGKELAWFFMAVRQGSQAINQCFLIDSKGKVVASAKAQEGDGSWLGSIRGKCAIANFLLAATDDGIQRVQTQGSQIVVAKEFPDASRVVDADSHLFPGNSGLSAVSRQTIWNVTIS
jgi:H/ACA ribonucleoprotein complex subunit 3